MTHFSLLSDPVARLLAMGGLAETTAQLLGPLAPTNVPPPPVDGYSEASSSTARDILGGIGCLLTLGIFCNLGCGGGGYNAGQAVVTGTDPGGDGTAADIPPPPDTAGDLPPPLDIADTDTKDDHPLDDGEVPADEETPLDGDLPFEVGDDGDGPDTLDTAEADEAETDDGFSDADVIDTIDIVCLAKEVYCDGEDDDCNGFVDDFPELNTPCEAMAKGACALGTTVCIPPDPENETGSLTLICQPGEPKTETCNGVDDNCDGTQDEPFAVGGTCTVSEPVGKGACANTKGFTVCGVDGQATCDVKAFPPQKETCNGADDDCDGDTDEFQGELTCGVGACAVTTDKCIDGIPQECTPAQPGTEVCNGIDDDCDGLADDHLGFTTCGTGACETAVVNCVEGAPQDCIPGVPGTEVCNDIDDDCDGALNNVAGMGDPCKIGIGICGSGGVWTCDPALGTTLFCNAPVIEPQKEFCDGKDNDCDGLTDEKLGTASCGTGACAVTTEKCIDGVPQGCTPAQPGAEVCNGIDDDCNGATDELLGTTTCGTGACEVTVTNCVEGVPQTCTPGTSTAELCNDADDDCDGTVDNVAGMGGPCKIGLGICVSGGVWTCDPAVGLDLYCNAAVLPPSSELCDGLDNDCDGVTDEVSDGLADADGDGLCDALDADDDNDGVEDLADNCHLVANSDQADFDVDGLGDLCDDSDGDGALDGTDNCKTVANADQARGIDPNGLACTPICIALSDSLIKMQVGQPETLTFQVSAAEEFSCGTTAFFFGTDVEEQLKTHLAPLVLDPPEDTIVDACTVSGFGLTVICPPVEVDVNHPPVIGLGSPSDGTLGLLPGGDQCYKNTNTVPFTWQAGDSDGDTVTCHVELFQSGKKVAAGPPVTANGTAFASALAAGKLQPRIDYCWNAECGDGAGGVATSDQPACFTTTEKGTIGQWLFNEGAGTLALDSSGNGHHGTIVNALHATDTEGSKGLKFDGAGDFVQIPAFAAINSLGALTVWVRFKPDADNPSGANIIDKSDPNESLRWTLEFTGKHLVFGICPPGGACIPSAMAQSTTAFTGPTWATVQGIYDGTLSRFFVNGVLESQSTTNQGALLTSKDLFIGRWGNSLDRFFKGAIDEVVLFATDPATLCPSN